MSLYQKYRPDTLEGIKGNNDVVTALENMLSNLETCPHAFLLTGETGCGKTTIGRIIAKRLGCSGRDFNEVDSGQFRGIDTIREIRSNSKYKPIEGRCIVWLLDEIHKATNDAQNALLKILEDTPAHVYFILCTTEPQKLINTIKGRCSTFQLKTLNDTQMTGLIRKIAHEEGQKLSPEILQQIAQDSLGHPRNAIQILEQVLNVSPELQLKMARQAAAEQTQSIDLCRALIKGSDWKAVSTILKGLSDQEPESIRRHVLGYCQSILLNGSNDRAAAIIEQFYEPLYNIGMPGLVYNCYAIIKS